MVPSGRSKGGKDEEVKLLEIFLARCQKDREELEETNVDKYDDGIQCSGCGRCVRLCPVNIDIRRVARLMNSHGQDAVACEVK